MKEQSSLPAFLRQQLGDLHAALLRLHKALLDAERALYERNHGRMTPAELLQRAINDPQFAWLRQISELIVRIDELVESTEPGLEPGAKEIIAYARSLLAPNEAGSEFQRTYDQALQRQPEMVLLHRKVMEILSRDGQA